MASCDFKGGLYTSGLTSSSRATFFLQLFHWQLHNVASHLKHGCSTHEVVTVNHIKSEWFPTSYAFNEAVPLPSTLQFPCHIMKSQQQVFWVTTCKNIYIQALMYIYIYICRLRRLQWRRNFMDMRLKITIRETAVCIYRFMGKCRWQHMDKTPEVDRWITTAKIAIKGLCPFGCKIGRWN